MWSFGTTMTMPKDHESQSSSANLPPPARPEQTARTPTTPPTSPPAPPSFEATQASILSPRSLKQLGLFFAGAGFLSLATLVTRRSIARKMKATVPRFFIPSNRPSNKMSEDSSLIAFEALNLATLNVMGFGIMMTGGLAWAFDFSNIEDLRKKTRRHTAETGAARDEEAERELVEWVSKLLYRGNENKEESDPTKGKAG